MSEYQVTYWRELPSLVTAREGEHVAKVPLPQRFQDAVDEAAMRLGAVSSDEYLAGWERGPWLTGEGDPAALASRVSAELEQQWPPMSVASFLDGLGPAVPTN